MVAASKPTSSLSKYLHLLFTARYLGTLAAGLACLPLAREAYPSRTDSRVTLPGIQSLISLSLLPIVHQSTFQCTPVRSSTTCYGRFNLTMGRSPRLRVYCQQLKIALFGLAFASPPPQKGLGLPLTITRRLIKQKARHHRLPGFDTL